MKGVGGSGVLGLRDCEGCRCFSFRWGGGGGGVGFVDLSRHKVEV